MFEVLDGATAPTRATKYSAGLEKFLNDKTGTYCGKDFNGTIAHVKGFEGTYIISLNGDVYSIPRNGTKNEFVKLKTKVDRCGYVQVILTKNNIKHYKTVHRLVATTFIPNSINKPQVNHRDGNKTNNKLDNLEWVTAQENKIHAIKNGLSHNMSDFNKRTKRKLSNQQLCEVRNAIANKSMMQKDIAEKYGISKQAVTLIKQGKTYEN